MADYSALVLCLLFYLLFIHPKTVHFQELNIAQQNAQTASLISNASEQACTRSSTTCMNPHAKRASYTPEREKENISRRTLLPSPLITSVNTVYARYVQVKCV